MWNRVSRFAVVEHQDGRSGVECGVDPATKSQPVEFEQGSGPGLYPEQPGDCQQIQDRRESDDQQRRQVMAAPGKPMLQVLQGLLGKAHRKDVRSGLAAGRSSGPVPQVSRYQSGILARLRKALLGDQGVGNPADHTKDPQDQQFARSVVLLVASVAVKTSAAAVRTLQPRSDLLESSCPVLPGWR